MFHDHETHCFILIQDVSWPCFILIQHVSRPCNKLFHCWFILIQHVSSLFHRSDSSCFMLIQPVSLLFHHCFITVSPVGTSIKSLALCTSTGQWNTWRRMLCTVAGNFSTWMSTPAADNALAAVPSGHARSRRTGHLRQGRLTSESRWTVTMVESGHRTRLVQQGSKAIRYRLYALLYCTVWLRLDEKLGLLYVTDGDNQIYGYFVKRWRVRI